MPFKNMTDVKIIGDDIYLIENFLSDQESQYIYNLLSKSEEDSWNKMWPEINLEVMPTISPEMKVTELIINRLEQIVDGYDVHHNKIFTKLIKGDWWGEHSDNADFQEIRKKSKELKDGQEFRTVENTAYGVVVYINDNYSGGDIFYTKQNFLYKPKSGDLIVHSAEEKCEHGVREVTDGVRYAWSSNLGNLIRIPIE